MAPAKDRVANAFKAMKSLGIRSEDTKPALKRLYNLFDGNWDVIEEDSYRMLADTIFELKGEKMDEGMDMDEVLPSKDKGKGIARTNSTGPDSSPEPVKREVKDLDASDHGNEAALGQRSPMNHSELANSSHNGTGSTKPSSNGVTDVASRDRKKAFHRVRDISKGSEKVKISLADEHGLKDLPKFVYCPESIAYESANVHIALARIADEDCCVECEGDCLWSSLPCACAGATGGEFAYSTEGLLTQSFLQSCLILKQSPDLRHLEFCKDCPLERAKNSDLPGRCQGHVLKKFIKECWRKCGCNMMCGNRVVQRGITRKLEVFSTKQGKGWGLRTLEELPQGAFVCEYAGEILTNIELYERNSRSGANKGRHVYPVLLDADWATEENLKDEEALCLDATEYGNVARFINHRCHDANLIEIPVQVETPDRRYYHVAFFTIRKVEAREELTWDYGIDFHDENHPIKAFRCRCGSDFCRDTRDR